MASGLAASVKLTRQPRQLAPCAGTGARARRRHITSAPGVNRPQCVYSSYKADRIAHSAQCACADCRRTIRRRRCGTDDHQGGRGGLAETATNEDNLHQEKTYLSKVSLTRLQLADYLEIQLHLVSKAIMASTGQISQVPKRDGSNAEFSAWNIVSSLIRAGAASGEFGRNGAGVLAERLRSSLLLSPSTRLFRQLASTVLSMNRVSLLKAMRQVQLEPLDADENTCDKPCRLNSHSSRFVSFP